MKKFWEKTSKATPEDVDRALKSAAKGLEVWKKLLLGKDLTSSEE